VKPQLARFEALGPPGIEALEAICAAAGEAGLLVIADGKRGDVPVTAGAYGRALVGATDTPWGPAPGLGADAFTVNPLLGRDSSRSSGPPTPAPPTSSISTAAARRCTSGSRRSSTGSPRGFGAAAG
jgi:hypothetical protein